MLTNTDLNTFVTKFERNIPVVYVGFQLMKNGSENKSVYIFVQCNNIGLKILCCSVTVELWGNI